MCKLTRGLLRLALLSITVNLTRNYTYGLYALPLVLADIGLYLFKRVRERNTLKSRSIS